MPGDEQDLALLTRYTAWANARLYDVLSGLSAERMAAPTPIFAGSILRTLNHVYLMDVVWKSHLLGMPHGLTTRNPEATPSFAKLRADQTRMDAWFVDYAATLTRGARDESVHFRFIGGGDGVMTRADIITHIANHATYHRGHVTAMLYALGIQPPVTDLPVFCRDADAST